jgi:DNA-binding GntR family transcriptional regulator
VASLRNMREIAELEERMEALCAQASLERPDSRLLAAMEDLLAEGYICALRGDHRTRGLQKRFDAAVAAADGVEELQAIAHEQRMVAEATRNLRSQLAVMHERWLALAEASPSAA